MGKQVKTPRFYVDIPTFLHATGQLKWDTYRGGAKLLYMNPSNPYIREDLSETMFAIGSASVNNPKTSFPINFCALLNHNLANDSNNCRIVGKYTNSSHGLCNNNLGFTEIINANHYEDGDNDFIDPTYNGTSIWSLNELDRRWTSFEIFFSEGFNETLNHQLGSFVVGKYWDAPNSPDLNLTMSRSFDGIRKQKTIGGKTLANIYYDGPTEWTMNNSDGDTYKYPVFELDIPWDSDDEISFNKKAKSGLGRKGLRSWNLTFSYISEDNMWTDYETSNTSPFDDTGYNSETGGDATIDPATRKNPMLSDESFNFVWNCTLGGTLPFIFQPNADQYDASGNLTQAGNNNPDQFSICTFRQNTLSVKQVAYNTYTLSITIDEVA